MKRWQPNTYALFALLFLVCFVAMCVFAWVEERPVALLGSRDPRERGRARMVLIARRRAATPVLLNGLRYRDPAIRKESARLLGKSGDQRAIRALRAHLRDRDSSVRQAAKYALFSLKDRKSLRLFYRDIYSNDSGKRAACLAALTTVRDEGAVRILLRALEKVPPAKNEVQASQPGVQTVQIQIELATAIARTGVVAVDVVVQRRLKRSQDLHAPDIYFAILDRMEGDAKGKLADLLRHGNRGEKVTAAIALSGKSQDAQVREALVEILSRGDEPLDLRAECLVSLKGNKTPETVALVVRYLKDAGTQFALRSAALDCLGDTASKAAQLALFEACLDPAPEVRRKALEVVARFHSSFEPDGLAVPYLSAAAKSRFPEERAKVAKALQGYVHPKTDQILSDLLRDPSEEVVRAAVTSIPSHENGIILHALAESAAKEGVSRPLRSTLLSWMSRWSFDEVGPVLQGLSKHEDPEVAQIAMAEYRSRLELQHRKSHSVTYDAQTRRKTGESWGGAGLSFPMISTSGDRFDLHKHLQSGKVSLIVFTAGWSEPGRKLAEDLGNLVNRRKDLYVAGVDIVGWHSEVAKQYGIRSVPVVWIFDQSGKLVSKNSKTLGDIEATLSKL